MTVGSLLLALRREADAERERLLAAAREEARQLAEASRAEADGARAARVQAERSRLAAEAERRVAEQRRKARGAVLAARQRLLDRVFAAALDLMPKAGAAPAYRDTLAARLSRALACAGGVEVDVRCAPRLLAPLKALEAGRGLAIDSDPAIRGGLRVVTRDGALAVDDTLEGALERRRAELSLAVLRDLAELSEAAAVPEREPRAMAVSA